MAEKGNNWYLLQNVIIFSFYFITAEHLDKWQTTYIVNEDVIITTFWESVKIEIQEYVLL